MFLGEGGVRLHGACTRWCGAVCNNKKKCHCWLAMSSSFVGMSGGVYYRDTPQHASAAQRERVVLRQDDLPVLVGDVPAHQPVGDHVRAHALLRWGTVSVVCSCSCACGSGVGTRRPKPLWRPLCAVLRCLACVGYRFEGVDDGSCGGVHAVLEQREVELCPLSADVPELLEQVAAAHGSQAARVWWRESVGRVHEDTRNGGCVQKSKDTRSKRRASLCKCEHSWIKGEQEGTKGNEIPRKRVGT